MRIRVRPSAVMMAAGLALSGCIDIECPPEFARPTARERFCGHSGYVAMPTTYRQNYAPLQERPVTRVTTTTTTTVLPPGPPTAAPVGPPVTVEPVPAPGPTTIR